MLLKYKGFNFDAIGMFNELLDALPTTTQARIQALGELWTGDVVGPVVMMVRDPETSMNVTCGVAVPADVLKAFRTIRQWEGSKCEWAFGSIGNAAVLRQKLDECRALSVEGASA